MFFRLTVLNTFANFSRKHLKWSPFLVKFQAKINIVNAFIEHTRKWWCRTLRGSRIQDPMGILDTWTYWKDSELLTLWALRTQDFIGRTENLETWQYFTEKSQDPEVRSLWEPWITLFRRGINESKHDPFSIESQHPVLYENRKTVVLWYSLLYCKSTQLFTQSVSISFLKEQSIHQMVFKKLLYLPSRWQSNSAHYYSDS